MYKIYPDRQGIRHLFLYGIYISFRPSDVSNAAGRFPDSFHHNDKIAPFHRIAARLLIIFGNLEMTGFKAFDIHHQTAILGMEKLSSTTAAAYEDEYITVPDTAAHTLVYHTAEGTDTLCAYQSCRGRENTASYHSDRTWQQVYWLIKREAASSILAPKWARTPLGKQQGHSGNGRGGSNTGGT